MFPPLLDQILQAGPVCHIGEVAGANHHSLKSLLQGAKQQAGQAEGLSAGNRWERRGYWYALQPRTCCRQTEGGASTFPGIMGGSPGLVMLKAATGCCCPIAAAAVLRSRPITKSARHWCPSLRQQIQSTPFRSCTGPRQLVY